MIKLMLSMKGTMTFVSDAPAAAFMSPVRQVPGATVEQMRSVIGFISTAAVLRSPRSSQRSRTLDDGPTRECLPHNRSGLPIAFEGSVLTVQSHCRPAHLSNQRFVAARHRLLIRRTADGHSPIGDHKTQCAQCHRPGNSDCELCDRIISRLLL